MPRGPSVKTLYDIRRLKLGRSERLDELALAAGQLYSTVMVFFWRTVRKKGVWLSPQALMRLFSSKTLHAHSADAVVQAFCAALKSWRNRRKTDPNAKPPRRCRKFFKVQWKSSAIRLKDGVLILSNGRGNAPLEIPWQWELPKLVEIGWDGDQYDLRATYVITAQAQPIGTKVVGVDLGEVHLATAHDGESCTIANGRELRSKKRYQNKTKAKFAAKIDRKKPGSRRRKRLVRSKQKQLRKLRHQVREILHKQTTHLISTLYDAGVQTVVIGDVREIRQGLDYGAMANQKIHQMHHGEARHDLTYKAQRLGMTVVLQEESYTSQTCPACGHRKKPNGREYRCGCGFVFHRDGVGSWNVRSKYLGTFGSPVVGPMARPTGLRFRPHARVAREQS
jgi:putative transposase